MISNYRNIAQGITRIDTQLYRPQMAACYLIEHKNHLAFIDTGTNHSVPILTSLLEEKGLTFDSVDYVIPTHVHLDHAGGAGALMQLFPNAKLVVHPRGARHMIDPAKLQAGATAVYGKEEFEKTYGDLVPVSAERVIEAVDNLVIDLNGRLLTIIDTPGHARHHICIFDAQTSGFFTGDTFGISYRELDVDGKPYLFPTSTPVQFEPDAWNTSLDRLLAFKPERMYLTHFDMVEQVAELATYLRQGIKQYVELATKYQSSEQRYESIKQAITQLALDELQLHGCKLSEQEQLDVIRFDMELNAQGLEVWLNKVSP